MEASSPLASARDSVRCLRSEFLCEGQAEDDASLLQRLCEVVRPGGQDPFCFSSASSWPYAFSHAAATTLLAAVLTVFNESWPGQYNVGRRFDTSVTSFDSVDAGDLITQNANEITQMYPIYLARSLISATTRIADTFGPLAFLSVDKSSELPWVELNMSPYMVVDAPLVQASWEEVATCNTLTSQCNLTVGWSEQVLSRLPDTSLSLGKHEGIQSAWQRALNLSSLSSEAVQACESTFAHSMQNFLEVAALAAYNKTVNEDARAFAPTSPSLRKRAQYDGVSIEGKGLAPRPDPAWHSTDNNHEQKSPFVAASAISAPQSSSTTLSGAPAPDPPRLTPNSAPMAQPSLEHPIDTPSVEVAASEPAVTAPATLRHSVTANAGSHPAATISSPASASNTMPLSASQGAASGASAFDSLNYPIDLQGQARATAAPVLQASDSSSTVLGQSSSAVGPDSIQAIAISTISAGGSKADRVIKVVGPSSQSPSMTAASNSTSLSPSHMRGSSDLQEVLNAGPGTLIHSVDYWCLFTMASQEWYCAMLLAIAAASLLAAGACLRTPIGLDASSGGSIGLAIARSEAACLGLANKRSERYLRRADSFSKTIEEGRLAWLRVPGERAKLYPIAQ